MGIDEEIRRALNEQYDNCKKILSEKKDIIEKLAERLLEKETLSLPEIVEIMGPRPFPLKETLKEYLQELKDRMEEEKMKEEELKVQAEKREETAAAIAFDADADEADEEKEEKKSEEAKKKEGNEDSQNNE